MTAAQALTGSPVVSEGQVNVLNLEQQPDVLERVLKKLEAVEDEITTTDQIASRTDRRPFPLITVPGHLAEGLTGVEPAPEAPAEDKPES
jgi:anion-transporting  ArsA/GET3 family ATPase